MRNSTEKHIKEIRRRTRKKYSAEEKIRIVMEGLRGEDSIAELCRKEGINQNVYYRWSKEFLEAGKQRLAGDIKREATSNEVTDLKQENDQLKRLLADIMLKNDVLKKVCLAWTRLGKTNEFVRCREIGSHSLGRRLGASC